MKNNVDKKNSSSAENNKRRKKFLVGVHVSISGGIAQAPLSAKELGCRAMQVFSKNQRQWCCPPLKETSIAEFKANVKQSGILPVSIHASYLINLAASDSRIRQKSIDSCIDELNRAELLGFPYMIVHPGSHLGKGESWGFQQIAECINIIFSSTLNNSVQTLLETTAGQGTNIGYRFEHLRQIMDLVQERHRIAICADTCHLFAAGYDLANENLAEQVWEEFDSIIGLNQLKVIHLNDSKNSCGSRVDRHEHIGQGYIGALGFNRIVNHPRLAELPMILETPGDDENDRMNIKRLMSYRRNMMSDIN